MGNFILNDNKFITEKAPDQCRKSCSVFEKKSITVINTPDLIHPTITGDTLNEHVKTCVRLSDPGPHVFLLVLQPEDFTEDDKLRLCRVLTHLSDRAFDHSMVLISTPRDISAAVMADEPPDKSVREMIVKCQYRHLKLKNLEHAELLTRMSQIVKENGGHVTCDVFEDTTHGPTEEQIQQQEDTIPLDYSQGTGK